MARNQLAAQELVSTELHYRISDSQSGGKQTKALAVGAVGGRSQKII